MCLFMDRFVYLFMDRFVYSLLDRFVRQLSPGQGVHPHDYVYSYDHDSDVLSELLPHLRPAVFGVS